MPTQFLVLLLLLPSAGLIAAHPTASPSGTTQDDQCIEVDANQLRRRILAASEGSASEQASLAAHYLRCRDYTKAVNWLEKAAAQGAADAQGALGSMYDTGMGVTQDYVEAAKWYRLAAEQGMVSSQSRLGRMYVAGQGVVQDWAEAVRWLRNSAEQGDAEAQFALGVMYIRGDGGLRRDAVESYKWISLAATRATGERRKTFMNARNDAVKTLTRRELAEAQSRTREWQSILEQRQRTAAQSSVGSPLPAPRKPQ